VNGAQWLVQKLKATGVERVFVLCGNGLDPFLDACLDARVDVLDVHNEQAAAYMADLWGRMTRQVGVVAVSSGPGHTNALTGLANAWWDGGPMLLISGSSPQDTHGLDNFQELDQVGMTVPVTKYASMVHHAANLPTELYAALSAAVSGRPGPVHLTIPLDVFRAEVPEHSRQPLLPPTVARPTGEPDPDLIRRAVELLADATRPFIVVGSGAFYADAGAELIELAAITDIPIVSHIWDRCCIERAIPQYVGVTNSELNPAMARLAEADVVLVIGARLDYRVEYGRPPGLAPDTRVIRIDVDPAEINRARVPDVGIVSSPRSALRQMIAPIRQRDTWDNRVWLAQVRQARAELLDRWAALGTEDVCPVPGVRICREIKPFLDRDVTFLIDGGNIGRWAHMTLFDRHPSHWLTCGASGVVGWGLPGAIAARLARPDHPVLLLSGDGAAGFTLAEIQTAIRFGTPYVAVIAHDGAWGIVADGQDIHRRVACEFGEIRFDLVARALGAEGVYIEDPREIGPSIERGLAADTVTVIHVPTQQAGIGCWEERFGCLQANA